MDNTRRFYKVEGKVSKPKSSKTFLTALMTMLMLKPDDVYEDHGKVVTFVAWGPKHRAKHKARAKRKLKLQALRHEEIIRNRVHRYSKHNKWWANKLKRQVPA